MRPTYDRQVGATEEGRQYFINRWNIWKETIKKNPADGKPFLDAEGNPHRIDVAQRETRTITYYMNPEFPDEPLLREEAQRTIDDWDMAMRETVAGLRLAANSSVAESARRQGEGADAAAHHRAQGKQLQPDERA